MHAVSDEFLAALRSPSMRSSILVTASDGTVMSVRDGSVSMDSNRAITRTCDLDLTASTTMSAEQVYKLVMTPNMEFTVRRGLWTGSAYEYVSLGVFSTDSASIDRATTGGVDWSGSDRSKKISRARFTDPYQILRNTTLADAGTQLLQSRWAYTPCDFSNVLEVVGATITFDAGSDSDPWDSARKLFADYGYDLNFDGSGVARAVPIPDPASTAPIFDFGEGSTNLILGAESKGTLENVYNGVIATGEGSEIEVPVRAEVWDTDPTSPTYFQGGYGRVPLFYSSPLLTSTALAQTAAATILARLKGRSAGLDWPAIVNPALEPLDVITLNIRGSRSTVVIDSLTIPLKASDSMTASARQVTA